MVVIVEYTAQLKRAAGTAREEFDLSESSTLLDLVDAIADRHGEELTRMLKSPDGTPQSTIIPFVGDEQARWSASTVLKDGVTITLLSPISGG
jgi:molybdopterin converting factor small subunit